MQVHQSNFDPDSVALMGRVCDEAWRQTQATIFFPFAADSDAFLHQMAARVMAAVSLGERDPVRLKAIAMDGLDG
jgi:hypothetical protein